MLEEMDAKEAEMRGSMQPEDDLGAKAMEVITAEMSHDQREGLDCQINNEREEAEKIFTEDDLNFENYDNLMDKKLPVDQELVDKQRKKLGVLEKVKKDEDKPKSMSDVQDVIKNNQGVVKRQNKDDKKVDQSINDKKD